jgi:hypothetical protein
MSWSGIARAASDKVKGDPAVAHAAAVVAPVQPQIVAAAIPSLGALVGEQLEWAVLVSRKERKNDY